MRQLADANGTLSFSVCSAQSGADTERIWKYIANNPAKNISSLESHTMVPTATMLGRVAGPCPLEAEGAGWVGVDAVAVATLSLCRAGSAWRTRPPVLWRERDQGHVARPYATPGRLGLPSGPGLRHPATIAA